MVTISLATLLATQCAYTPPLILHCVLPDNYIGWVRIDFGVASAPEWNFTETVTIPETGVEQTQFSFGTPRRNDEVEFSYDRGGHLVPVPDDLYDHSLFASTLVQPFKLPKKSAPAMVKGSWYFFVGPPSLRGQFPSRGVLHRGAKLPTPGRITTPEAKPQSSL